MEPNDKKNLFLNKVFGEMKVVEASPINISGPKPKKPDTDTTTLVFFNLDTEGWGVIDAYQLQQSLSGLDRKTMIAQQKINLPESQIKHLLSQSSTEFSSRVPQKVFQEFQRLLQSKCDELKAIANPKNIYELYAAQFVGENDVPNDFLYFSSTDFVIQKIVEETERKERCPVLFLEGNDDMAKYLKMIEKMFFGKRHVIKENTVYYNSVNPATIDDFFKTTKCKKYSEAFKQISDAQAEGLQSVSSEMCQGNNEKSLKGMNEENDTDMKLDVRMVDIVERSKRRKINPNMFDFFNPVFQTPKVHKDLEDVPVHAKDERKNFVFEYMLVGEGHVEQITSTFCLVDVTNKRKLCSDYYVELNRNKDTIDAFTHMSPALIRLWPDDIQNDEIWGVVRYYKNADGDIDGVRELYEKGLEDKKAKKYREKIATMKLDYSKQQLLFVGLIPIDKKQFEKRGQLLNFKFYREDVESEKKLFDLIEDIKMKKAKEVVCHVWVPTISYSPLEEWKEATARLFDGKERNKELEEEQKVKGDKVVDIPILEDLCAVDKLCDINNQYVNRMIVSPTEVFLGKERKRAGVIVKVALRESDGNVSDESLDLKVFYPQKTLIKKGTTEMLTGGHSSFSHSKVGQFFTEMRIELPFPLKKTHHLLFSIFDVSAEESGNTSKPLYAVYPLFNELEKDPIAANGQLLLLNDLNGEITLPIMKNPNKNYLSHQDFMESTKTYLKVKLSLFSTIYPTSSETYKFIQLINRYTKLENVSKKSENDDKTIRMLEETIKGSSANLPESDCVHFLPVILNGLLGVTSIISNAVFDIVNKVSSYELKHFMACKEIGIEAIRHPVLSRYLLYHCECNSSSLSNMVIKVKTQLVSVKQESFVFGSVWFFFEVMTRIVVSILDASGNLVGDRSKGFTDEILSRFKKSFLQAFYTAFSDTLRQAVLNKNFKNLVEANLAYVQFLMKMFRLMGRSEALVMLEYHIMQLSSPYVEMEVGPKKMEMNSEEMIFLTLLRLDAVNEFSKFPYIDKLCLPNKLKVTNIEDLEDNVLEKYLPTCFLLRQYLLLIQKPSDFSKMAVMSLISFLQRLDLNINLQSEDKKGILSDMLMPLLLRLIDEDDYFITWANAQSRTNKGKGLEEVELLMFACLYVFKIMDDETLRTWLENEVPSRLKIITNIIKRAIMILSQYPLPILLDVENVVENERKRMYDTLSNEPSQQNQTKETSQHKRIRRPSQAKEDQVKETKEVKTHVIDIESKNQKYLDKEKEEKFWFLKNNMIFDCVMVAMDVLEMIYEIARQMEITTENMENVENDEEGQTKSALVDVENVINEVLFDCPMNRKYAEQLFAFVRKLLLNHYNYIFTRRVDFSFNLLKNILKLCGNEDNVISHMAMHNLYIFSKINFLCDMDLSRISNHIVCALGQLQNLMTNKLKFEDTLGDLVLLPAKDFGSSKKLIEMLIALYKEKGVLDSKYLFRIQQLQLGIDAGESESFLQFMADVIDAHNRILEPFVEMPADLVNGYTSLKEQITGFFSSKLRVRGIDVKNVKKQLDLKYRDCVFKKPLIEKCDEALGKFGMLIRNLNEINTVWQRDQTEALELESVFGQHTKDSVETLKWIIENVLRPITEGERSEVKSEDLTFDSLLRLRVEREKDEERVTQEVERRKVLFSSSKGTTGQENPYFPVKDEDFEELLDSVKNLFSEKVKLIKTTTDAFKRFETSTKELENTRVNVMNEIEEMHSMSTKKLYDQPLNDSFTESTTSDFSRIMERVEVSDSKVFGQFNSLVKMTKPWYLRFEYWKLILPLTRSIGEMVNSMIRVVQANSKRMNFMREWHKREREHAISAVRVFEWSKTVELLMRQKDWYQNQHVSWLSKIADDCLTEKPDILKLRKEMAEQLLGMEYLKSSAMSELKRLNPRKRGTRKSIALAEGETFSLQSTNMSVGAPQNTGRLSTDSSQSDDAETANMLASLKPICFDIVEIDDNLVDVCLDKIEEMATKFKEQKSIEENYEEKRKEYNTLQIEFAEKKESLKVDDEKFFANVQELKQKRKTIVEMEKMEIPELNAYCDYHTLTKTVTNSTKQINEMVLEYSKKSTSTDKSEEKKEEKDVKKDDEKENKGVSDEDRKYFLDENDYFKEEAFLDVNRHKQQIFDKCVKEMNEEMKKMMNKLVELDESNKVIKDPDFIIWKFYESTKDYESNPRLHLTWFNKMADKNKENGNDVEAGMCELHMVHYIYNHIANRQIDLPQNSLKEVCTDFLTMDEPKELQENNDCSFETMANHIKFGIQEFEAAQLYNYALVLCNFELPFYEETENYSKLAKCHAKIKELYSKMDQKTNAPVYSGYFFLLEFVGAPFESMPNPLGYIYRSVKPLDQFKEELLKIFKPENQSIEIIDKNGKIKDETKCYMKVTLVYPVVDSEPIREPQTLLTNTASFMYEKDTGSKAPLMKREKERFLLTTELSMPCGMKRVKVVKSDKNSLTPIMNASDDLEIRFAKLAKTFSDYQNLKNSGKDDTIQLNKIQECIGMLLEPKHSESVYEIMDAFLGDPSCYKKLYSVDEVNALYRTMQRICECVEGSLVTLKKKRNNEECKKYTKLFDQFKSLITSLEEPIYTFDDDDN
ncbi:hypothetical protein EIN_390170 [Entamoeba invadens IP1]|uniref:Dedicator of cytokinesis protein n=1 Tax=Entamoeba invadens IP1 TaxID=370355 RepID=A0A0A1U5A8_ENTIV|nr:hypothetical protein EIN_390170 [Entamoeba invadens IP1]ELP89412.1 hypothetical protein EIN_390170 [Entamoeba invadens IP1]|eukprot:XP_004256183.1 hypothetical protein EIN_390170 [Entamoeba invadens IP1]